MDCVPFREFFSFIVKEATCLFMDDSNNLGRDDLAVSSGLSIFHQPLLQENMLTINDLAGLGRFCCDRYYRIDDVTLTWL